MKRPFLKQEETEGNSISIREETIHKLRNLFNDGNKSEFTKVIMFYKLETGEDLRKDPEIALMIHVMKSKLTHNNITKPAQDITSLLDDLINACERGDTSSFQASLDLLKIKYGSDAIDNNLEIQRLISLMNQESEPPKVLISAPQKQRIKTIYPPSSRRAVKL